MMDPEKIFHWFLLLEFLELLDPRASRDLVLKTSAG